MEQILKWCGLFCKLAAFRQPSELLSTEEEPGVVSVPIGEGEEAGEGWQQYLDPSFKFKLPEQPFTQFLQQYEGDVETLIANEGEDILEEPGLAKLQPEISQVLSGYQKFHMAEDAGVKASIGRVLLDLIARLTAQAPIAGPGRKLKNWLEAVQSNVSQDLPESLESQQMRRMQEIQESSRRGKKYTREMPDDEFEAMLESMQERMEGEITRNLKNRPTRRVRDRQKYLEKLLTTWHNIDDPEEKAAMKERVLNLLKRREELGMMAG